MNDTMFKFILGAQLFILTLIWTFTNPYHLRNYLRNLLSARVLVVAGLETIMILQILDLIRLPLPILNFISVNILGICVTAGGLIFATWAKLTMKKNWGVPAQHDISKQKELVTSGPFAYSRNPIYVGLMLFFFGYELAMGSGFIVLIIPLFYLIRRAVVEEETLLKKYFGNKYETYLTHVPRFIK